jgi:hypothetical protein
MGHEGVRLDPKKIQAMQDWSRPTTLNHLRGFLGLTKYYRKFVHHYGKIAQPLADLLRKNVFHWTHATEQAFTNFKEAMCTTLVLAAHDFKKYWMVESNASGTSIGAVLTQYGRPLAFTIQALSGRNLGKSTYEK